MVRIRGNYDDVNRLCTEIADKYGWAIVNVNLRPYYTEGAKTFGFEIAEQLGWQLPQHTVVPTAGGTILPKIYKGYQRADRAGARGPTTGPRSTAPRRAGCNPVVKAIQKGQDIIEPQKPNTIAKSIAIGNPADGYYAYHVVKDSGGWGESATDPRDRRRDQVARPRLEGIWTEPAGGTTLAAAIKLIASGRIPRDESICHLHHRQRPQDAGGGAGRAAVPGRDRPEAGRVRRAGGAGDRWPGGDAGHGGRVTPGFRGRT